MHVFFISIQNSFYCKNSDLTILATYFIKQLKMKYLRSLSILVIFLLSLLSISAQTNCDSLDYQIELINPDFDSISEYGERVLINLVTNFPEWKISSIEWMSDEELNCYDCLTNHFSPTDTTTVQLQITLDDGCIVSDDITYYVVLTKKIYVPTVFSPNDDGINDHITIYTNHSVERIKSFMVFSRKGHLVHEAYHFRPWDSYPFSWDGRFRGKNLHSETYVWKAVIEYINGEEEVRTGTVDLIR